MKRAFKLTIYALGITSTVAVGVKEISRSFAPRIPTSAEEARQLKERQTRTNDSTVAVNR